ncbi:hypothetical protein SeLEV6574_g04464 [Synchytrium endobioticum]|uniref:Uncharacterized protein n=1 Tax=Synchytrium endobioticum TaxID=286115 RepID=A0A507CZ81_9FUNG|nr:hypothetical protein SeLEV6574_g04464 [Synchytrium endobioticum]
MNSIVATLVVICALLSSASTSQGEEHLAANSLTTLLSLPSGLGQHRRSNSNMMKCRVRCTANLFCCSCTKSVAVCGLGRKKPEPAKMTSRKGPEAGRTRKPQGCRRGVRQHTPPVHGPTLLKPAEAKDAPGHPQRDRHKSKDGPNAPAAAEAGRSDTKRLVVTSKDPESSDRSKQENKGKSPVASGDGTEAKHDLMSEIQRYAAALERAWPDGNRRAAHILEGSPLRLRETVPIESQLDECEDTLHGPDRSVYEMLTEHMRVLSDLKKERLSSNLPDGTIRAKTALDGSFHSSLKDAESSRALRS